MHVEAFERYLGDLHKNGILRSDLDIESAASSLYSVSRNCFRLYLMRERATVADLRAQLRRDLSTVFRGFLDRQTAPHSRIKRSARR
jgi:hypothetical protein